MMRRPWFQLFAAVAFLASCKGKDNTKIVVAVWSEFAAPSEIDTIRIDATATRTLSHSFPIANAAQLPATIELVPTGAKDATFTVTAVGLSGPTSVVSQSAQVTFASGQARLLKLVLRRNCGGLNCPASTTCSAGVCGPIPVAVLSAYDPGQPLVAPEAVGVDGGADAGPAKDADVVDTAKVDVSEVVVLDARPDLPVGTGGTSGSGGSAASGGVSGTAGAGGTVASGGSTGGSGGNAGTGGTSGNAGNPGSGGVSSSGGTVASGGIGGTAGSGGSGAAAGNSGGTGGVISTGGVSSGGVISTGGSGGVVASGGIAASGGTTIPACVFGASQFGNCKFGP